MRSIVVRLAVLVAAGTLALPALAQAAGLEALQPFPSNLLTAPDAGSPTGLRVALPQPNCATNPSDCADVAVLNTLDGFNLQPRIDVPFSAPIDLSTVSGSTVALYDLSCLACAPVGIDQVVWEPLANTLHVESGSLLKEGGNYLLVVTTGIRGADGSKLSRTTFLRDMNYGQTKDLAVKAYRKQLKQALDATGTFEQAGAASLFTTQTATDALATTIRSQLDAAAPAPATIDASFPLATITSIVWNRQISADPAAPLSPTAVPVTALAAVPGAVGAVAFGHYSSPQYQDAHRVIGDVPAVQSTETIRFNLFLPAAPAPAGGYPVALFGHGFGDSKNNSPFVVAASMAAQGIATIAINVVGHGRGPAGTLTVNTTSGPTTLNSGGRGYDQDGNGTIDSTEGVNATAPYAIVSSRDGLRQTVVDLMQLARVIHGGGIPGLSTSRIFYFGQSFGGIYGTELLGSDPLIRAGVPNVPGGPIVEIARLSPSFRPLVGGALITRVPSLYNAVPNPPFYTSFNENTPLRGEPIRIDTVTGASAIQQNLDRNEWVQQAGSPVPYARRISMPVLFQFAKGDMTVPNPTTTAILRAGNLAGRATYFRNDIAGPGGTKLYANPHTFLTSLPAVSAFQAQAQIATFLASDGAVTIDPDGAGPVFETPIAGPLPETLNFP